MNSGLRTISVNESAKTFRSQRSYSNSGACLVSYSQKDFQTIAQILTLAQSLHNKCDTHGSHYNLNLTGATSLIMSNTNDALSTSTVGASRNYEIKPNPQSVEKFKDMSLSEVLTAYRKVLKINDEKSDEAHLYKLVLKMSMKKNKKGGVYKSWTQIFAQMRTRYKNKYKAYQWRENKLKLNAINGLAYLAYKSYQPAPTRGKSFKQINDENEAPQLLKTNRVHQVRKILKEVSLNPQKQNKFQLGEEKKPSQEVNEVSYSKFIAIKKGVNFIRMSARFRRSRQCYTHWHRCIRHEKHERLQEQKLEGKLKVADKMQLYFKKRAGILAFKLFRNRAVKCRNLAKYVSERADIFSKLRVIRLWVKRYSKSEVMIDSRVKRREDLVTSFHFWETRLMKRHFKKIFKNYQAALKYRQRIMSKVWFLRATDLLFLKHCNYQRQGYQGMYSHFYAKNMLQKCFNCLKVFTSKIHHFKGKLILKRYLQKPFTAVKNVTFQEIDRREKVAWMRDKKTKLVREKITLAWKHYTSKKTNLEKKESQVRKKLRRKRIVKTFKHWFYLLQEVLQECKNEEIAMTKQGAGLMLRGMKGLKIYARKQVQQRRLSSVAIRHRLYTLLRKAMYGFSLNGIKEAQIERAEHLVERQTARRTLTRFWTHWVHLQVMYQCVQSISNHYLAKSVIKAMRREIQIRRELNSKIDYFLQSRNAIKVGSTLVKLQRRANQRILHRKQSEKAWLYNMHQLKIKTLKAFFYYEEKKIKERRQILDLRCRIGRIYGRLVFDKLRRYTIRRKWKIAIMTQAQYLKIQRYIRVWRHLASFKKSLNERAVQFSINLHAHYIATSFLKWQGALANRINFYRRFDAKVGIIYKQAVMNRLMEYSHTRQRNRSAVTAVQQIRVRNLLSLGLYSFQGYLRLPKVVNNRKAISCLVKNLFQKGMYAFK